MVVLVPNVYKSNGKFCLCIYIIHTPHPLGHVAKLQLRTVILLRFPHTT